MALSYILIIGGPLASYYPGFKIMPDVTIYCTNWGIGHVTLAGAHNDRCSLDVILATS